MCPKARKQPVTQETGISCQGETLIDVLPLFLWPPLLLSRLFPLLPEVESWRAFEAESFLTGAGSALFLAAAAFWAFSAATLYR